MAPTASIPLGDQSQSIPDSNQISTKLASLATNTNALASTAINVVKAAANGEKKLSSKETIDLEAKHGAHK